MTVQWPQCNSPAYESIRWLEDNKGPQDAFIYLVEIALRHLRESAKASNKTVQDFTGELRKRYGPGLAGMTTTTNGMQEFAARWYVVDTHAVFDVFLNLLIREYKKYKKPSSWKTKKGGEQLDSLSELLTNIESNAAKILRATPEYAVIEHYRLMRNWILHEGKIEAIRRNQRTIREKFCSVIDEKYVLPNVPSDPERLDLLDFKLYTRSITNFVIQFNNICPLSLVEIAEELLADSVCVKSARHYKTSQSQITKHITNLCRSRFLMRADQSEAIAKQFIDHFKIEPKRSIRVRQRKEAKKLAGKG